MKGICCSCSPSRCRIAQRCSLRSFAGVEVRASVRGISKRCLRVWRSNKTGAGTCRDNAIVFSHGACPRALLETGATDSAAKRSRRCFVPAPKAHTTRGLAVRGTRVLVAVRMVTEVTTPCGQSLNYRRRIRRGRSLGLARQLWIRFLRTHAWVRNQ